MTQRVAKVLVNAYRLARFVASTSLTCIPLPIFATTTIAAQSDSQHRLLANSYTSLISLRYLHHLGILRPRGKIAMAQDNDTAMTEDYIPQDQDLSSLVQHPLLKSVLETCGLARGEVNRILKQYYSKEYTGTAEERQLALTRESKKLTGFLAMLRAKNRQMAHHVRDVKADTAASREELDDLHLQLQNLYYEQRHLRGEIDNCLNYPHPYMDLPLIPLEEFFQRQPHWLAEGLVDADGNGPGENDLMRARINEEYRERVELEEERQKLVRKKMELENLNAKKRETLSKFDVDVEKRIQVCSFFPSSRRRPGQHVTWKPCSPGSSSHFLLRPCRRLTLASSPGISLKKGQKPKRGAR